MKSKICLFLLVFLKLSHFSFSQKTDSAKSVFQFGGAVLVTNNGISLIPTFSLGEPAAIFNIYMAKKKLSFEPELRFSLEGKPWSFLFWWRYKLVTANRFRLGVGAHPAMNFRTIPTVVNGDTIDRIVTRRYLAAELTPNYFVAKNISIGFYYLYSHGIDREAVRNTHFLTFNSNFSDVKLVDQLYMRFTPQVYYLRQNSDDGLYATATVALAHRKFPISTMAIFNKEIETNIPGSQDFNWNISLIYSFNKVYVEK